MDSVAADRARTLRPDDAGLVVDIQFTDRSHVFGPRFRELREPYLVFIVVMTMVMGSGVHFFARLAALMVVAYFANILIRRHRTAQLESIVSDAALRSGGHRAEALIRLVAGDRRSKGLMHDVLLALSSQLVREGSQGQVFRLHLSGVPPVPRPLEVPFEPRPLNEEIRTTEELLTVDGRNDSVENGREAVSVRELVREWVGRQSRRVRNNGPTWILVLSALMALASIWAAWGSRDATLWLGVVLFGGFFVLFFFTPIRHRDSQKEWYIVPSGIAVRAKGGKAVPVSVFDRRKSVMVMAPWHPESRCWNVAVADAQSSNQATLSPDEVTLLLRAWLSPLRSPGSERISDLM